jgi:iron only hydrogenase large subunit-like protein
MNPSQAIYTEKNNCQDCYKCVRHCPVKAIKIESHSASIIYEQCIFCGKCSIVCPVGAKKVRNDTSAVKFLLKGKKKVILSLAPSWVNEFEGYTGSGLIAALKALGFYGVSETALGAEVVSKNISLWLKEKKPGPSVSGCCPVVVELIKKYYPNLIQYISPFLSPMETHGLMLKEYYGEDTMVVFAGPCIAKKNELMEENNHIDVAITFQELQKWFNEEGFIPDFFNNNDAVDFIPELAGDSTLYPIDGGMIKTIKKQATVTDEVFMSFSGMNQVRAILDDFEKLKNDNVFLELLSCEGGCVNGPAVVSASSPVKKRLDIIKTGREEADTGQRDFEIENRFAFSSNLSKCKEVYSEQEIMEALRTVGKTSSRDELNCGGCGYNSCRDFAISMIEGKAERQMCVSYMRRVAQNKASVLLQKIPYGVVMIDENGKIIESNNAFAELLGPEGPELFNARPGLEGALIGKLVSFSRLFETVINTGAESIEKDVYLNGRLMQISVFTIQKHKIVCGIIHDLERSAMQKDALVSRLKSVIAENMATAQKAAFLLGENVSQTETMLNSVITLLESGDHEKKY